MEISHFLRKRNGVAVTWTTDKPEIVDVQSHENEGYDATPAGTVTRPDKDTDVTMTATLKLGDVTATKDFTFTVKKAVKAKTADDYSAYFFTYFAVKDILTESRSTSQQVRMD